MESLYPKHREDIRITDHPAGEETHYILVDDENQRYYRFAEIEFDIFRCLDGKTPLEKIKEEIERRFEVESTIEEIQQFVGDLKGKGLLEGAPPALKKGKVWGSIFYLRKKIFNPEKLLERLLSRASFTCTRRFVIPSLFVIFGYMSFSWIYRTELIAQTVAVLQGAGVGTFYLSLLSVGFVHEMGHAFVCRYYGGKVKEVGVILIYFIFPGFYANVSDAYLFREKLHRAAVGAAGLFFQFLFSALCLVLMTFTVPGTVLYQYLFRIVAFSGIIALWNFNPLIKLDGYYVLVDLLEATNLRANSFQHISLLFQKWVFDNPEAEGRLEQTPPRLKKIYFWYGVFGGAYTGFFIFIAMYYGLRFWVHKLAGFGLLIAAAGIAWVVWKWYKGVAEGVSKFIVFVKGSAEHQTMLRTRFEKLVLLGAAVVILLIIPTRWGIKGSVEVRPATMRALAPLESGVISKVFKTAGETLRAGEVVAELDDFNTRRELAALRIQQKLKTEHLALLKADYGASLSQAQGNLTQSRLALEAHEVLSPHRVEEAKNAMEAAEAQVEKAQANMRVAKDEWDRYQVLAKEELASPKEAEEKQTTYEGARQEFLAARRQSQAALEAYERTLTQATSTDPQKLREDLHLSEKNLIYAKDKAVQIAEAQSDLDGIGARIKTDEQKVLRFTIRSPIDGMIMTSRMKEYQGKSVGAGQPIGWVYEPGPMIFEIRVDELDIPQLPKMDEEGNDVTVKLLAVPGKSFQGKITRIVPESLANITRKSYLVIVAVNDREHLLLPGMQGTGKIYGHRHLLFWQIIRRPVKYIVWKLWSLF